MGYVNYIIIEELRLIIETQREVDRLDEYVTDALGTMIDAECGEDVGGDFGEIGDVKISDLTVRDLSSLYTAYRNAIAIRDMNKDMLLLYWLNYGNISYEISSEYNIDLKEFETKGFVIVTRWRESTPEQLQEEEISYE
jgi:hypothetical protein